MRACWAQGRAEQKRLNLWKDRFGGRLAQIKKLRVQWEWIIIMYVEANWQIRLNDSCLFETHAVFTTCPHRRCVWSPSTPIYLYEPHHGGASHVHHRWQSSFLCRCPTNLEFSSRWRHFRREATNLPTKVGGLALR